MSGVFTLASILKDSNYSLSIFMGSEIKKLESKIISRDGKAYINCIIRDKEIQLKPEEIIRQLYTAKLIGACGYPKQRIKFEHAVSFGRETKSADIVIFDKDRPLVEYIIVEVKKPKLKDGKAVIGTARVRFLSHGVAKAERMAVLYGGSYWTVPELFFEKKLLIPALQLLLISYSRPTG